MAAPSTIASANRPAAALLRNSGPSPPRHGLFSFAFRNQPAALNRAFPAARVHSARGGGYGTGRTRRKLPYLGSFRDESAPKVLRILRGFAECAHRRYSERFDFRKREVLIEGGLLETCVR